MLKPIIQGSVAWQDLYDQGYVVVKKDEYEQHWPHPQGWRPIETAPKDGTEILASECGAIDVVKWWKGGFREANNLRMHPDVWMPLPEPPK